MCYIYYVVPINLRTYLGFRVPKKYVTYRAVLYVPKDLLSNFYQHLPFFYIYISNQIVFYLLLCLLFYDFIKGI